jgi:hypothetical protein
MNKQQKDEADLIKERVAVSIITALIQHGIIPRKSPKQNFVKKESEWKKRRINGLR